MSTIVIEPPALLSLRLDDDNDDTENHSKVKILTFILKNPHSIPA